MTNVADHGVYLGGVNYLNTNWTFDYNNYYSLNGNIGYASGNQLTLANWQNATKRYKFNQFISKVFECQSKFNFNG